MTKYRRRVLNNALLTDCETTPPREVCDILGADLVEFNGEPDHMHLLVRHPPALPIREPVHRLRGATARRMRTEYTGRCNRARTLLDALRLRCSTGGAPLSIIKQYIENQARPL